MTANDIEKLLAQKHSGDVFVPQCKDGPSYRSHGMLRMDAWVMPRSWAHPAVTVYEIKVSRSDFLNDNKWRGYLDFCNMFYFAAPPGIIDKEEVPAEAGLIITSKNGTRLYTKKKAPHRDVEIPETVFRYILMSRAFIKDEWHNEGNVEYWRQWLREKQENRELGRRVAFELRYMADKIKRENKTLKDRMGDYDEIKRMLDDAGLDGLRPSTWSVRRRITELKVGCPDDMVRALRDAKKGIDALLESVNTDRMQGVA